VKFPEDIRVILTRRYRNGHRVWLSGEEGQWPMAIGLDYPAEDEALRKPEVLRAWILAWKDWSGPGEIVWRESRWRSLGAQSVPERVLLRSAEEVAHWIDQIEHWRRLRRGYQVVTDRFPALAPEVVRYFADLGEHAEEDVRRLLAILDWFEKNPQSGLYPRQIPVLGVDTKWLERRTELISNCLAKLRGGDQAKIDFYAISGLKRLPHLIRLRILDPSLREQIGGLGDMSASPEEIARLRFPLKTTYIIENLQTGLALGDLPGSVAFMGLGNGVDVLSRIPWLTGMKCIYWGDIDTHGFSILSRLRSHLPQAASLLMDKSTLLEHKQLWGDEEKQYGSTDLPNLTETERALYQDLKTQHYAINVRLEQERVPWNYAWPKLLQN
jgi:hypothetical protein